MGNYYYVNHPKEYWARVHMPARCSSDQPTCKKYYKDKGIKVDPVFESFERFFEEVGPAPGPEYTIDRIENDKGYIPGNLRWATMKVQQLNRSDFNVNVTYKGESMLLCQLAEKVGVNQKLLRMRIFKYGWPVERAIEKMNFKTGKALAA